MKIQTLWRAERKYSAPSHGKLVRRLEKAILEACPALADGALSVAFLSREAMTEANENFLGHHGDTDVITFDYRAEKVGFPDPEEPDVELLVCPAVAEREALRRSLPYSRELMLYLVHGLLHAHGYDDLKPELKRKMRAAERRVMNALPSSDDLFPIPADGGK